MTSGRGGLVLAIDYTEVSFSRVRELVLPQDTGWSGRHPSEVARPRGAHAARRDLRLVRELVRIPGSARSSQSRPAGGLRSRCSPRDSVLGVAVARKATMLVTVALALLVVWGLGIAGVYAVGQIVHVLLLVGLLLLLLSVAKAHEAAGSRQGPGTGS